MEINLCITVCHQELKLNKAILAYLMLNKVVKLSVDQRVQGRDTAQCIFRDLLMHLRTGDSTEQDQKLLLILNTHQQFLT